MRAHLLQLDIAWEDPPANVRRIEQLLEGVRTQPGELLLLPEMFNTGFSMRLEATAPAFGEAEAFLRSLARERRCFVVASAAVMGQDGRGRNRALCCGPEGQLLATYDKVHPFSFGKEPERFSGGDRVVCFDWSTAGQRATALRVCPTVCYDLRFPELFRAGLLLGAACFVVVANWPSPRAAHWRALAVARAIENQAFVLAVNRAGSDPHLTYAGGSLAVGPQGEVLAEADEREQVLSVDLDPEAVRSWRATFPAWRDAKRGLLPRLDDHGRFDAAPPAFLQDAQQAADGA